MYLKPNNLEDLKESLKRGSKTLLSGGTDLIPLVKNGVRTMDDIVDIRRVPELKRMEKQSGAWFIGAAVTLAELSVRRDIAADLPALVSAAGRTASQQIRNLGTIAGNIMQDRRCIYYNQSEYWRSSIPRCFKTGGTVCHQIPTSQACRAIYYSDIAPVLCAYRATVLIFSEDQEHTLPVEDLIGNHVAASGRTHPEHLLIEGFLIPVPEHGVRSSFIKLSMRSSIDFPTIHFAGTWDPRSAGSVLYAGAIAEQPVELTGTEERMRADTDHHDILTAFAVKEISEKCRLVKEAGISIKVKKDTFRNICYLFEQLL